MQIAVKETLNPYHVSKGSWYYNIIGMFLIPSSFLLAYFTLYVFGGKLC